MLIKNCIKWSSVISLAFIFYSSFLSADTLQQAVQTQVETDTSAQASQKKIDNLAGDTTQMLAEYRQVLAEIESLRAYNKQLAILVTSQQKELTSITEQLANIETTQHNILPMMLNMVEVLTQFVALDLPFLPEERQLRVEQLNALMQRADVTLAEKYRRILEAYQVETEYGRTIEAYQGELTMDGEARTVDFLRIGRVNLYYQTLNGLEVGMWDPEPGQWVEIDEQYRQGINKALKVAKKQLSPDLLLLPMKTVGDKK